MEREDITNALVRTTTAVTMFNAGIKVTSSGPSHTPFAHCPPTPPVLGFIPWLLLPHLVTAGIIGRPSAELPVSSAGYASRASVLAEVYKGSEIAGQILDISSLGGVHVLWVVQKTTTITLV